MTKRLTLRREALTELGSDDLAVVVGGSAGTCYTCILRCLTDYCQREPIPSLETPCYD